MINNTFKAIITFVTLSIFTWNAFAQGGDLKEKKYPVGEFSTLELSGDFEVTLSKGDYGVTITTDNLMADYVQVYVRTGVLHIGYDDKDAPKDVKKEMKAKKNPVFRAVVSVPQFREIALEDNVVLTAASDFSLADFSLKMEDKTQIKDLAVSVTSARISLTDKSQAKLTLNAVNDIELEANDNAVLQASADGKKLSVKTGGSGKAGVEARAETVSVNAGGRSELTISGRTKSLSAGGDRNGKIDALGLPVSEVVAKMGGGELSVKVDNTLDVDLTGGAEVYYSGDPEMKVRRIVKSTLAPISEKKR